jgi:hypothetical protein
MISWKDGNHCDLGTRVTIHVSMITSNCVRGPRLSSVKVVINHDILGGMRDSQPRRFFGGMHDRTTSETTSSCVIFSLFFLIFARRFKRLTVDRERTGRWRVN